MSKIRIQTKNTCIICDEPSTENNLVVLHKTRRQVHSMCLSCLSCYLKKPLERAKYCISKNIRKNSQYVKCSGRIHGIQRNMCRRKFDITKLQIPVDHCLYTDIFRIKFTLQSNNHFLCPETKCGNVVQVDPLRSGTEIVCGFCDISWCRQCFVSPFHKEQSCLEYELKSSDFKNNTNKKHIKELTQQGKLKFCPKCKAPTIKHGGCRHMTCEKCGAHWCWLCFKQGIGVPHFTMGSSSSCAGRLYAENSEIE